MSINIVHVFPRGKAVLLASQHVVETTHIQRHLTQQMFIVLRGIRQPLNQPPGAVDVTTGANMAHHTPPVNATMVRQQTVAKSTSTNTIYGSYISACTTTYGKYMCAVGYHADDQALTASSTCEKCPKTSDFGLTTVHSPSTVDNSIWTTGTSARGRRTKLTVMPTVVIPILMIPQHTMMAQVRFLGKVTMLITMIAIILINNPPCHTFLIKFSPPYTTKF